ncbi:MAG: hypothetical protein JWQ88_2952 [Rhodoferax sp.]|nr:hypothetical protein [Rhodoferax sp.]
MRWRILADDLTGALDTAAAFAQRGDVPVLLGPGAVREAPVQAVATGSRNLPVQAMEGALAAALPWFTGGPAGLRPAACFKKVDSLMRGNSFAEIAWLQRHGGFDGMVLAPAFPAQGRFTRHGRHWVGLPHLPDHAGQPGNAGLDAAQGAIDLVEALAAHGVKARVGNRPGDIEPGEVLVPDVTGDVDLARLAAWSVRTGQSGQSGQSGHPAKWLWCGSAGLAWALAAQANDMENANMGHANDKGRANDKGHANDKGRAHEAGPSDGAVRTLQPGTGQGVQGVQGAQPLQPLQRVQLVTASRHPVLRAQWASVAAQGVACADLAHPVAVDSYVAAALLRQRTAELVAMSPRPDILVVVGGDTLLALCHAAGVQSLLASTCPRGGWGRARLCGGAWDGVTCYSRSGAFGAPDDLSALLAMLAQKEHAP